MRLRRGSYAWLMTSNKTRFLSVAADVIGGLFSYHDRNTIRVSGHKVRRDGIVSNSQSSDPVDLDVAVDD